MFVNYTNKVIKKKEENKVINFNHMEFYAIANKGALIRMAFHNRRYTLKKP